MQSQPLILVVEDDPDIGLMIKIILEQRRPCHVVVCETAELAKSTLENGSTSVIIMDLFLSGYEGSDLCRSIKLDQKTKSIPVLMISAHPKGKEVSEQVGADDYLAKPFELSHLLAKVDHLLEIGSNTMSSFA